MWPRSCPTSRRCTTCTTTAGCSRRTTCTTAGWTTSTGTRAGAVRLPPVSGVPLTTMPQSVGPGPPAPFDAGMVGAEIEAVGHQQPAGEQEAARDERGQLDDRGQEGERHQRRADIIGHALLVAELAGDVAADVLEAERAADGGRHRHGEEKRGRRLQARGRGGKAGHAVLVWRRGQNTYLTRYRAELGRPQRPRRAAPAASR
jgi:hypothetical protein